MADRSSQNHEAAASSSGETVCHDFAVPVLATVWRYFLIPSSLFAWIVWSAKCDRMGVAVGALLVFPFVVFGLVRLTKTLRIEISSHSMQIIERTILLRRAVTFPLAEKPATQFHRQMSGYWCIEIFLQKPFRFGHGFWRKLHEVFALIEMTLGRDPAAALAAF